MATLTMKWYGEGIKAVAENDVEWLTGTMKVALLANTYTPAQGTHSVWADVSTHEVSGSGYTEGGATLGTKALTYDDANFRVTLDAADVTWDPSTITARYAVIYDAKVGGHLLFYGSLAADESSDAAAFTIAWHADGIGRTTAL